MVLQSLSRDLADLSPTCFKGYIFSSRLAQGVVSISIRPYPVTVLRFFLRWESKPFSLRAADSGGNKFCPWLGPRPRRCQSLDVGSLSPFGPYKFASLCLHPKLHFQVMRMKGKATCTHKEMHWKWLPVRSPADAGHLVGTQGCFLIKFL